MIFLWSFGLVVEGKLGWWKTLAIYLGLGVVQCVCRTGMPAFRAGPLYSGSLGDHLRVHGNELHLGAENSLQCVFFFGFYYVKWFDVPIKVFVGLFLALQLVEVLLSGMALSSGLLHVIGAGLGFAVGIWMVKTKRVDCENWDIFSIRAGRHRMSAKDATRKC